MGINYFNARGLQYIAKLKKKKRKTSKAVQAPRGMKRLILMAPERLMWHYAAPFCEHMCHFVTIGRVVQHQGVHSRVHKPCRIKWQLQPGARGNKDNQTWNPPPFHTDVENPIFWQWGIKCIDINIHVDVYIINKVVHASLTENGSSLTNLSAGKGMYPSSLIHQLNGEETKKKIKNKKLWTRCYRPNKTSSQHGQEVIIWRE